MKRHAFLACALTIAAWPALAQTAARVQADSSAAAASAPSLLRPNAEPNAAERTRDLGTPPGGARLDRPPVRQIQVPIGRDPSASQPPRPARPASAASMPGVDDAVARCEAERDAHVRAVCRARLAREGRAAR